MYVCGTVQLHLESVKASLRTALPITLPLFLPYSPNPSSFSNIAQTDNCVLVCTHSHTCAESERDREASSAFCAAAAAAKAQTLLLCPRRRLSVAAF